MLFAQYLLTPLLESCQTWYSGCPWKTDVPYRFSGHVIKGQGKTAYLHPRCCLLTISMVTKLATLVDFPHCFLGHKVKVKLLIFVSALSTQYLIFYQSFESHKPICSSLARLKSDLLSEKLRCYMLKYLRLGDSIFYTILPICWFYID